MISAGSMIRYSLKLKSGIATLGIVLLVLGIFTVIGIGLPNVTLARDKPSISNPQETGRGDTPMTDIHDIKPALPMGMDLRRLMKVAAVIIFLAIAAALGWLLWRRRRKAASASLPEPLPPPEVEAYAGLDALATEDHLEVKLFYFRLSAILRRYIERRYEIPAAEMTTEELLPIVGRLPIESDLTQELKELCLRSDPIKFAAAIADRGRLAPELAFARDFVRRTTSVTATSSEGKKPAESPFPHGRAQIENKDSHLNDIVSNQTVRSRNNNS